MASHATIALMNDPLKAELALQLFAFVLYMYSSTSIQVQHFESALARYVCCTSQDLFIGMASIAVIAAVQR